MDFAGLLEFKKFFSGYTELRRQENTHSMIRVIRGAVAENLMERRSGVSARSHAGDKWGFAASDDESSETVRRLIGEASRNARLLCELSPCGFMRFDEGPAETRVLRPRLRETPRAEMIDMLRSIDGYISRRYPGVTARLSLREQRMEKSLVCSSGSASDSLVSRCHLYAALSLRTGTETVGLLEMYGGGGAFADQGFSVPALAERLDNQVVELYRKAEGVYPEAGEHECVLSPELAGILAHEAVGHTVEADFVLAGSVAGGLVGREVAAPAVSITDFAAEALGAECPLPVMTDDEGVAARDEALIENGILKGFMHNRVTAERFGAAPSGNARAYLYSDEPLIRMRNTAILPGKDKIGDMISSVDRGYYLMSPGNGQADTTGEFMFSVLKGYEIKGGKLGRVIRDTTVSGVAFTMLGTVTMLSDELKWSSWGTCGKKQPMPVGMGGPAVKCRITVGGR